MHTIMFYLQFEFQTVSSNKCRNTSRKSLYKSGTPFNTLAKNDRCLQFPPRCLIGDPMFRVASFLNLVLFRESAGFLSRIGAIKKSLEEAKQVSNNITEPVATPTSENLDAPTPQADAFSPKFESGKFQHVGF